MTKIMMVRTTTAIGNILVCTRAGTISVMALALSLLLPGLASAAFQTGDTLNVKFHGTLKRKPCYISNNLAIDIPFGKIGVSKVDGINYKRPIEYTLQCADQDPSAQLTMRLQGKSTSYNDAAIETNSTGLGILILKDGLPMKIGEKIPIVQGTPPLLQAVPVKQQGITLTAGDFSAVATLLAEYQ